MHVLLLSRLILFGIVLLFSIIILALSAFTLSFTEDNIGLFFVYSAFALAISLITLVFMIPVFVFLSILRSFLLTIIRDINLA